MSAEMTKKLLIVDDEVDVHYSFTRLLAKEPLTIVTASSGEEGIRVLKKEKPDVVVMDIRMGKTSGLDTLREMRKINPKQIILMMTAYGTSQTAIEAMKLGAFDYLLKPFDIPQLLSLIRRAVEAAGAVSEASTNTANQLDPDAFRTGIVGTSPAMQQIYKLIGQVTQTDTTVLITGESGTGKELVARAIHSNSKRNNKMFVAINCAAIPENLLESELFGHEKGAFTGAFAQRIGRFEQCDGGTLFLDEIGEMPLTIQSKLLRVLQDGEFMRVGGNVTINSNVRIIAATNRDLAAASQRREFREDLYYRLNVFTIQLPPLRSRLRDVPSLVSFVMSKWRTRNNGAGPTKISDDALHLLSQYTWPGNVRELENCMQRAMVLANGDTVSVKDLPAEITETHPTPVAASTPDHVQSQPVPATKISSPSSTTLPSVEDAYQTLFEAARKTATLKLLPMAEKEFILRALDLTQGNQVQASKLLGITRATLRKRVDKFAIHKKMQSD
jgi:nitrogen regulation protein NR(I)